MSSAIAREVVLTLTRNLHRLDGPDVAPQAIEHIKAMQDLAQQIAKLVQPISQAKRLEGRALWESLAHAVVGVARAKRGARLTAKDLADLVRNHCREPDMAFWLDQYPATIVGLLRHEVEVRKLIEPHAVLFWEEEPDKEWRLVDTRWLKAHADIRKWVVTAWPGGRRCRFCGCSESPRVNALLPVNPERRNGVEMIGDTVVLKAGGVLTHDPCRMHWIAWSAIAAKYPTPEAAEAADRAAGRESRWPSVKTSALEAPVNE